MSGCALHRSRMATYATPETTNPPSKTHAASQAGLMETARYRIARKCKPSTQPIAHSRNSTRVGIPHVPTIGGEIDRRALRGCARPVPRILPPCYRGVPGGPFAHDLHDDLAVPGFVVELEEDDLLPRPQFDAAVDDRDREARSEERGADVAVAVSVVPPALVPVLDRRREEPIQRFRDVFLHEPRFELVRDDRARTARREDAGEAVANARLQNDRLDPFREIDRVRASSSVERDGVAVNSHGPEIDLPSMNLPAVSAEMDAAVTTVGDIPARKPTALAEVFSTARATPVHVQK